jgi:2'-5' RNA ligase
MRLFVAIELPEAVKDELGLLGERLCARSESASLRGGRTFTSRFVFSGNGEVSIIRLHERSEGSPFVLETGRLGRFRRAGGDIWWLGLQKSQPLAALQKRLAAELRREGFALEEREYNPHLTLGRKVVFPPGADRTVLGWDIPPFRIPVDKISLMKSERIGGRLTYTPVLRKIL